MNFLNILKDIEAIDPEITERLNPRRAAIKNITSFGSKIALSALPFALGTMFTKAYGQTNSSVNDVLNFALTLEYLEADFYTKGNAAINSTIPSEAARGALKQIEKDENAHVAFLKSVLKDAAIAKPTFDFEKVFPTVFTDYPTYLAVSQVLEDTGVRAYKGQAPSLLGNKVVLTAALGIHAVEARHASHIRQMRRALPTSGAGVFGVETPWVSLGANGQANDSGVGTAVDGNYVREDNIKHGDVTITDLKLSTGANISKKIAVESFDEPLTTAEVLAIANMFIVK